MIQKPRDLCLSAFFIELKEWEVCEATNGQEALDIMRSGEALGPSMRRLEYACDERPDFIKASKEFSHKLNLDDDGNH